MLKLTKKQQYELRSSYRTSPNIGIIKYWGKWHETEIIPLNDNIGVTLDAADLSTTTLVKLTGKSPEDQVILNGTKEQLSHRLLRVFDMLRSRLCELQQTQVSQYVNTLKGEDQSKQIGEFIDFNTFKFVVKSRNNFPTASGLASSSSGMSAFALCLSDILKIDINPTYLSRICSGSACRCLFGNFSLWKGVQLTSLNKQDDAETIKLESLRCLPQEIKSSDWLAEQTLVMIIMDKYQGQKDISSTVGMELTKNTSELLQARIAQYVPEHVRRIIQAFEDKDFNAVMDVVIKDSNQFHAVCLDTTPPLLYLNDFSRQIIRIVNQFNKTSPHRVGYSFDAGAHAMLMIHQESFPSLVSWMDQIYDLSNIKCNSRLVEYLGQTQRTFSPEASEFKSKTQIYIPSEIILTKIGQGPERLVAQLQTIE